jgi:uncharacterized repeat protein (TIGR03803 family)
VSKSRLASIFLVAYCLAAAIASPAQTLTTLYTFDAYHGRRPRSPLVQGLNGNFFGTTFYGGSTDDGTVFEITSTGALKSLYNFCELPSCGDGLNPSDALILGVDGDYYGTTQEGGAHRDSCSFGCGTVFKITPDGIVTTLYSFCALQGCPDGYQPDGLVQGADGNFYGTTVFGGLNTPACLGLCGTLFKLTPQGALTTLYTFCSQKNCADGFGPEPGLIQASNGNFYGTTYGGSTGGVVFEITPAGKYSVLYAYRAGAPMGLIQAANGNLYGTNPNAGAYGSVFQITLNGKFSTLYSFCRQSGCPDGYAPAGRLVQGTDGNLYGTASAGGANTNTNDCPTGCGTIFNLSQAGTFTNLYNFCSLANCADGDGPGLGMIQGTDGKFYGNTGINYYGPEGTIFSFDMGLGPYIEAQTGFGSVGRQIGILGNNLSSTTGINFHGVPATFQVLSDTLVRATVPAGATTGTIQLTNSSGTLSTKVPFIVR